MEPYIPNNLPPDSSRWNWQILIKKVSSASSSLAYYDGILESMINPNIFLTPLETKEAILSSRIEGTVTTLDEVLKYEVDLQPENAAKKNDIIEVLNYRKAMRHANSWLQQGFPFNITMVNAIQKELMQGVRGKDKMPGELRKEQVWIGPRNCPKEEATFVPPEPLGIKEYLGELIDFIHQDDHEVLIQTAIFHAQFEIIHPFMDGNGRTGRILIPLFLWYKNRIKSPMFYISEYFDRYRDGYISNLLSISRDNNWEDWINFFLDAIKIQAERNANKAKQVLSLYKEMKERIATISNSPYGIIVLDALFCMPIFRISDYERISGLNRQTVYRIIIRLKEEGILATIKKPVGRSPEIFRFEMLYKILMD